MKLTTLALLAALASLFLLAPARAWDAPGHRAITLLGLDAFHERAGTPTWLQEPRIRAQVADQSNAADRYRGMRIPQLTHANNPDHYIDIEDLAPYGLDFFEIPPLRYEFVKALIISKHKAGDAFQGRPINPMFDQAQTGQWPGFLPYAIMEHYAKLSAAFRTVRILEELDDPQRAHQLEMARDYVKAEMGLLSHFVGDAAQPLHTTMHHHGWIGDNPKGYTTDRGFHAYIDGEILKLHGLTYDLLKRDRVVGLQIDAADPWMDVLLYIYRAHEYVEPLYEMQRTGDLQGLQGGRLIANRLQEAGAMLGELYIAAWENAKPTPRAVQDFIRYDNFDAK